MIAWLAVALAAPVTVVVTPGWDIEAFQPLIQGLRDAGHEVDALSFSCGNGKGEDFIAQLKAQLPGDRVVVAHGFGATLVAGAAPELKVKRTVFLAPVLAVAPVVAFRETGSSPVTLEKPVSWREKDLSALLLGTSTPRMTCVAGPFADEVNSLYQPGLDGKPVDLVLPLGLFPGEVVAALSLGDDIATVEAVVPALRKVPDYKLVRLGMGRLDQTDFEHGDMLMGKVPVKWAVNAVDGK